MQIREVCLDPGFTGVEPSWPDGPPHVDGQRWIQVFAPAISTDGTRALVRLVFGPWVGDHYATATSLLERDAAGRWQVAWMVIRGKL